MAKIEKQRTNPGLIDDKSAWSLNASKKRRKSALKRSLEIANPHAAGIDIGSKEHFVAVPIGRDEKTVRSFSAYTEGLDALVGWLQACGITTVAMESTGVYWLAAFQKIEAAGIEVLLVDARSVKNVPGRKSDLKDCQWIQQLHSYGLLRAAFRPKDDICRLRTLLRHRKNLGEFTQQQIQHIQKALTEMNLLLHGVLTDVTGDSGLRILDAILAGERDPKVLSSMVDKRVKKSQQEIQAALSGDYRSEQLFVLAQSLALYRYTQTQIEQCDRQILAQLEQLQTRPAGQIASGAEKQLEAACAGKRKGQPKAFKTQQEEQMRSHLQRILGVDLTQVPGLAVLSVLTLLSEIGTDMSRWRNAKAFTSWLGLCPNHQISGGKILSARSRKVVCRTATILRMAVLSIARTQTPLGAFYRRKKAHLGAPKANTATARKLATLIYHLIQKHRPYQPGDVRVYELNFKQQRIASLRRHAQSLGFSLTQLPAAA